MVEVVIDLVAASYSALSGVVAVCVVLLIVPTRTFVRAIQRMPLVTAIAAMVGWLGGLYAYGVWRDSGARVTVQTLRPAQASSETIVLIHGWTGSTETWSSLLPLLSADQRFAARGIATVSFPSSGFFDVTQSLRDVASKITDGLADALKQGRLSIIAHSTGGVLARQVTIDLRDRGERLAVEQLVTYSAPHGGSDAAQLGGFLGLSQRLLSELRVGSSYLTQLSIAWRRLRERTVAPSEICLSSRGDNIVSSASAVVGCQSAADLGSWAHGEVQRPTDVQDERYGVLAAGLMRARRSD